MIVLPAAGLAYLTAVWASRSRREGAALGRCLCRSRDPSPALRAPSPGGEGKRCVSRVEASGSLGVIPIVLAANAFWW